MHIPVLSKEVIEYLNPKPGQNFIDCTLGNGGHTVEILKKTAPNGKLLGIDFDDMAIEIAKSRIEEESLNKGRIIFVQGNFANLAEIVKKEKFKNIKGILLDLGLRTGHLEDSGRGFSFQKDEPLDMRFGVKDANQATAAEIISSWPKQELERIFSEYGEERKSRQIAAAIIRERKKKRILTSKELVEVILKVSPRQQWMKIHPATKVFQALRIVVNNELGNLEKVLPQAMEILDKGGRLAVISFHSLEDRIVKHFFKDNNSIILEKITKKPIKTSEEEVKQNPKSRSAKLRIAEKI
ncbi:MAG: 16S rRNA (cytosine(1402)-N(4))-methyltransferase RsmH [Parcubacteria group bacterium]|nr:16S rRNA (cytosine(1402)-N(4))-methyltransferase RsmH [Parcubacteria group bacterium]